MDEKTQARIKKLQALAERGVGGEKETAARKLQELLEKNGISSVEELAQDEYATVSGTTVLIKDVEVLGLLRDYAEAQLTVNADNITAGCNYRLYVQRAYKHCRKRGAYGRAYASGYY